MLLFSIGMQSRFTEWCEALIAKLVERGSDSLLISTARTSEELIQAMIDSPSEHVLVCSRQPAAWLHRVLAAANGRCVVGIADPRVCVAEFATRHGGDVVEMTRAMANACASLVPYISLPGALVLNASEHSRDLRATARNIAQYLRLPANDKNIVEILDIIPSLTGYDEESTSWENRFEAAEIALINGALAGYADLFNGGRLGRVVWMPDLFQTGDNQPLTGPIELTGRTRFLVYGPYILLPPGRWRADVSLGFVELGDSMDFAIDVHAAGQLSATTVTATDHGVAQASLAFVIDPANDFPAEIRVVNLRAAFEGRLALGPVTLTPEEGPPQELIEFLHSALDR
jgi:hypothetical protein